MALAQVQTEAKRLQKTFDTLRRNTPKPPDDSKKHTTDDTKKPSAKPAGANANMTITELNARMQDTEDPSSNNYQAAMKTLDWSNSQISTFLHQVA